MPPTPPSLGLGLGLTRVRGAGSRLDPDAVAYAEASGATDIAAIDGWYKGLKTMQIYDDLVAGWVFRSGQNAGSGEVAYDLLLQNNATLVASPTWMEDGVQLDHTLTQYIDTPVQNDGPLWLFAQCTIDDITRDNVLVSKDGGNPNRDWGLQHGSGGANRVFWGSSIDGTFNVNRIQIGVGLLQGRDVVWQATTGPGGSTLLRDTESLVIDTTAGTLQNSDVNVRIGARAGSSSTNPLEGKVSSVLIFKKQPTLEQQIDLFALNRNTLQNSFAHALVGLGSSTMLGTGAGGNGVTGEGVFVQLSRLQNSPWRTPTAQPFGQGGTFPGLEIAEGFWEGDVKDYLATRPVKMWKRSIILQLGKNMGTVGSFSPIQSEREAAADRAIDMALDAISLEVTPYLWTVNYGRPESLGPIGASFQDDLDNNNLYNDYLVARCAALGVPCFDHRKYRDTFDWPTRNEDFFAGANDTHMSAAGCAQWIADFITEFPSPV
jgi:hypothetical protein